MAEDKILHGRSIAKRYIEVNGVIGQFYLENKKIKVSYFSTIANSENSSSHTLELLKELKPMRERVKSSELRDLSSLLQRNLNDNRVASELIPYLLKETPQVAFFTPILAVLIPKDSLNSQEESAYPVPVKKESDNGNEIISYNDLWKLERFKINTEKLNLGILSFDPNLVDLVVLDGQHRANAFRVVSGTFDDKESAIFPAFYSQIQPANNFTADLPVTIIWFEVDTPKFDPKVVSRRLFVDVNNTAKRVSRSRTILLEETEVISSIVRFFYSKVAKERSFEKSRFSLFHSGFDIDSDITISSDNPFAITNPQVFYDIVGWLTLGSTRYNNPGVYVVSREAFKSSFISFNEIFSDIEFNSNHITESDESLDNRKIIIKEQDTIDNFENQYIKKLHNSLIRFFDGFILFQIHFKACTKINEWYLNGMDAAEMTAWKEVFGGGEGLYYTFKDTTINASKKEAYTRYLKAIESIEKKFEEERAKLLPGLVIKDINQAFESASSKAFQVGILMALKVYADSTDLDQVYESFYTKLNQISEKKWVHILTTVRRKLMPSGVSPKNWPGYQKLILRLIQGNDFNLYSEYNFLDSPDGQIFADIIENNFSSWIDVNDSIPLETLTIEQISEIEAWATKAKSEIEYLFKPLDVCIIEADYLAHAKTITEVKLSKLKY